MRDGAGREDGRCARFWGLYRADIPVEDHLHSLPAPLESMHEALCRSGMLTDFSAYRLLPFAEAPMQLDLVASKPSYGNQRSRNLGFIHKSSPLLSLLHRLPTQLHYFCKLVHSYSLQRRLTRPH